MGGGDEALSEHSLQGLEARVKDAPQDNEAHCQLAVAYLEGGNLEAAKCHADKSLCLNDAFGPAYALRAQIAVREGELLQAITVLDQGLLKNPEDRELEFVLSDCISLYNTKQENIGQTELSGGYCSWCFAYVRPVEREAHAVSGFKFRCPMRHCQRWISRCGLCKNFACWDSYKAGDENDKKISRKDLLCQVHRGNLGSFHRIRWLLESPAEHAKVYSPDSKVWDALLNKFPKAAAKVAGGPFYFYYDLMRSKKNKVKTAAGVGVNRNTQTAGTSGSGVMAEHSETAPGRAFLAETYARSFGSFKIVKVRDGSLPALITVNGFLTENETDLTDWKKEITSKTYCDRAWYHLSWDSCTRNKVTAKGIVLGAYGALGGGIVGAAMSGGLGAVPAAVTAGSLASSATLGNLFGEAWICAERTGVVLADILRRCPGKSFVLLGHSLGAHVIRTALENLADIDECRRVDSVHLLAGATGNDRSSWLKAKQATTGKIYNHYSANDDVLKVLYPLVKVFTEKPIGRNPIEAVSGVENQLQADVEGHRKFKSNTKIIESSAVDGTGEGTSRSPPRTDAFSPLMTVGDISNEPPLTASVPADAAEKPSDDLEPMFGMNPADIRLAQP